MIQLLCFDRVGELESGIVPDSMKSVCEYARKVEQCERMRTDLLKTSYAERNIGEDIASLKRGACLLKYGHRGKPNFCPFRLSNLEGSAH
ncbi:hypothetical protein CTI12_AA425630 [Artemisia annua]|uniref:Uncharacterized protein n=1 Tax=Artemisia annua TaxID=35608 RepID=A0A2U1M2Z1_ARTAN|nr:hypothetical protein CTI12_AA425630 [Artemisia annua]